MYTGEKASEPVDGEVGHDMKHKKGNVPRKSGPVDKQKIK